MLSSRSSAISSGPKRKRQPLRRSGVVKAVSSQRLRSSTSRQPLGSISWRRTARLPPQGMPNRVISTSAPPFQIARTMPAPLRRAGRYQRLPPAAPTPGRRQPRARAASQSGRTTASASTRATSSVAGCRAAKACRSAALLREPLRGGSTRALSRAARQLAAPAASSWAMAPAAACQAGSRSPSTTSNRHQAPP